MASRWMTTRRWTRIAGACAFGVSALAFGACAGNAQQDDGVERERVDVRGAVFRVELALDDATRLRGLGGRASIPEDGGMLFVFPRPARLGFVMRDCLVPIDIAFLDSAGRVVSMHAMQPEPPRADGEGDYEYEARLRRYDSRFPAQFALEVAGGTFERIGLETGDLVRFDAAGLKRRAR